MVKDAKYLIAYTVPVSCFAGLLLGGNWVWSTLILTFGIIPFAEFFTPNRQTNMEDRFKPNKAVNRIFDFLLYLHLPVIYTLLYIYFRALAAHDHSISELIGNTIAMGIILGGVGINVAHELGHRRNRFEPLLGRMLLLPNLYMHFQIEHNLGHHKHVATEEDPASAPLHMSIYRFWVRSIIGSYAHAWVIESKRLKRGGRLFWSRYNKMLNYHFWQIGYLLLVGVFFGWNIMVFALAIAIVGILLLESVNYVEHYGLRRKKLANNRYEIVGPQHSWNSNHELGRIFLYELTRHTDHHMNSSKKYQLLDHINGSPQLPFGYPAAILVSLIPPLWKKKIHPLIVRYSDNLATK